jgi:hypothetical protein
MDKFVVWLAALMFLVALALPTTARAAAADQAAIHGVLLKATGRPAVGTPMAIKTPDGQTVLFQGAKEGGNFGLTGLAPGNYEIQALGPDRKTPLVSQKVMLSPGQDVRVEMRLGSQVPAVKTAAVTVVPPAVAASTDSGSTDSQGTGFAWTMSVLAGFVTLALCVVGAVLFGRRARSKVSEQVSGYGE